MFLHIAAFALFVCMCVFVCVYVILLAGRCGGMAAEHVSVHVSKKSVHENWVRSVLVHPSGAFILSASDDRSIRVFDVKVRRSMSIAWC